MIGSPLPGRATVTSAAIQSASPDQRAYRLASIDMLRGLVILVMALDHVRDFTMMGGLQDPMTDPNVSPWLFFTRWVTHFCAPVFVFLAGTSAGLMAGRKSPRELAAFLFKRGLWIVVVEITILSTAFTFSPGGLPQFGGQTLVILQTLWAIGASMVVLAGAQFLGARFCLIAGVLVIACHNLLDPFWPAASRFGGEFPLWVALHAQMSARVGPFLVINGYPLLPWCAVMLFGFGAAGVFRKLPDERNRLLRQGGLAMVALFVLLRAVNVYGDSGHWQASPNGALYTFMAFLNTNKYPPSLDYLLMTLGPAAIVCSYADHWKGWLKDTLVMFGRVPFAFYIAHFYLAHLLAVAIGLVQGFSLAQMWTFFPFFPKGFGVPLWGVYIGWLCVIALLYPLCRSMAQLKARRTDWWLSYL
jgi:uncharacterized membrane protein